MNKSKQAAIDFKTAKLKLEGAGAIDISISQKHSAQCSCGETTMVLGYDDDYQYVGGVGVCENCGTDDPSEIKL